jgi:hypothetical protein
MKINTLNNFYEFTAVELTNDTWHVVVLSKRNYEYEAFASTIEEAIYVILDEIEEAERFPEYPEYENIV